MKAPDFFQSWIKNKKPLLWTALFLILLSALAQFGLYALNQNYVVSHFGAQPEDISLSMQLTYVGVLAILPIQFRFQRYFERRSYILFIIFTGILLSITSLYTTDIFVFMVLRLLTGMEVGALAAAILMLFMASLPPAKSPIVGSAIFYGTILGNVVATGILTAWITDNYNWPVLYKYVVLAQVATLLIVLLILRPKANMKRYPLYQVDWFSFVASLSTGISFAYTMIYGPKVYWFGDPRIQLSACIAAISLIILFYRQTMLKRPYINLHVFKTPQFIYGLLLLIAYYGIKDSINLIYAYCAVVVKWDLYCIMWLAALNFSGVLIFTVISSVIILKNKAAFRVLFITGFALLAIYHLWMYRIFAPDMSFADLAWPVFFQGAASGLLLVPVIVFAVAKLPAYTGFTGITLAAMSRFTATLNSIAGFYTLQLYFNQLNKETFLRHLSNVDDNFVQHSNQFVQLFRARGFSTDQANALANTNIGRTLSVQSQLITDMHIFRIMFIASLCIVVIILLAPLIGKAFNSAWQLFRTTRVPVLK